MTYRSFPFKIGVIGIIITYNYSLSQILSRSYLMLQSTIWSHFPSTLDLLTLLVHTLKSLFIILDIIQVISYAIVNHLEPFPSTLYLLTLLLHTIYSLFIIMDIIQVISDAIVNYLEPFPFNIGFVEIISHSIQSLFIILDIIILMTLLQVISDAKFISQQPYEALSLQYRIC